MTSATGPLKDVKIIEFAGLGLAPCRDHALGHGSGCSAHRTQGRRKPACHPDGCTRSSKHRPDLKDPDAICLVPEVVRGRRDIVFEGFRPGVMERLGLDRPVAGAQPASRLRANDRVGRGRALCPDRRT